MPEQPSDNTGSARAAQYIRMSTEHQQYSTENQRDMIADFANRRGYTIVRTYADEGRSGLRIEGRDALRKLLADVQEGRADFSAILVFDVSRWGRFQDADESAYYEYSCKRAGIEVHYCSEQFENDGGTISTIVKSVKRAMAGEYSRELSSKVFKGQCRLIELGYRQGGPAGYGLRRMLIDQAGTPKGWLRRGEHKSLQTDRVILVPGPEQEISSVRRIYDCFIRHGMSEAEIAALLNASGILTDWERPWTASTIRQILTNEKYIGNNVFNRVSFKLKKKRVRNNPDMWVRSVQAFEPIVGLQEFASAQEILRQRMVRLTDEQMLAKLRDLISVRGRVTGTMIDSADGMPSSTAYRARFGSLLRAYRLSGFIPHIDYGYIDINRHLRGLYPQIIEEITRRLEVSGANVTCGSASDDLVVNGEFSTSMLLSRCRQTSAGSLRWLLNLDPFAHRDITIVARMDALNSQPVDFYLFPTIDMDGPRLRLCESNHASIDTYQFDTLDFFVELATRVTIEEAA
jgi:DNA invertase Pin-like site-specific DNA recombinase